MLLNPGFLERNKDPSTQGALTASAHLPLTLRYNS